MILGSFLLLFLFLSLHHVRIAGQLLPWELSLTLSKEILVLWQAEPLRQRLDVDVDLNLCQFLLNLADFLQLVESLLGVAMVSYDFGKSSAALGVLA